MVPEIDYNEQAEQNLPTAQRLPYWLILIRALFSPITRLYGIFTAYMNGETLPVYDSGTTYGEGTKVKYNYATWESLAASNTGNTPDTSPEWWVQRNANFIGATERTKYNGRYLTLTYALNKYFDTTFRQPPYPAPYDYGLGGGTFSDIYITNDAPVFVSFVSFTTETLTSPVFTTSTGNNFVFEDEIFGAASSYAFVIHIPTAVFTALGATDPIRTAIVDRFVALYAIAGTRWSIVTY